MPRFVTLLSCMAVAGAVRTANMKLSSDAELETEAGLRGCLDVNTATYLELKLTGLMSRGAALRIVTARSCPFKDASDLQAALNKLGNPQMWDAVSPLLKSGKLCVGCAPEGETKAGDSLDINKTPIKDMVAAGLAETVAGGIVKAMECKFTSFEDFKRRLEGTTYSGLDGGMVEFQVDKSWFNNDALCELVPPCDELCLPVSGECHSSPPRGWSGNEADLSTFCKKQCAAAANRCQGNPSAGKEDEELYEEEVQNPSGREEEPLVPTTTTSTPAPAPKPTGACADLCLPLGGVCQSFPPLGYKGMTTAQLDTFCAKECHPEGKACAGALVPVIPKQDSVAEKTDEQHDEAAPDCPASGNVIWNYKNTPRCRDATSMKFVKTACCAKLIEAETNKKVVDTAKADAVKADAEKLAADAAAGKVAAEKAAAAQAQADAAAQAVKDAKTAEAVCQAIFDDGGKKACDGQLSVPDVVKALKKIKNTPLILPAGYSCQKGYKCVVQSQSKVVRLVPGGSPAACGQYEGKGLTGIKTCVPFKLP